MNEIKVLRYKDKCQWELYPVDFFQKGSKQQTFFLRINTVAEGISLFKYANNLIQFV